MRYTYADYCRDHKENKIVKKPIVEEVSEKESITAAPAIEEVVEPEVIEFSNDSVEEPLPEIETPLIERTYQPKKKKKNPNNS